MQKSVVITIIAILLFLTAILAILSIIHQRQVKNREGAYQSYQIDFAENGLRCVIIEDSITHVPYQFICAWKGVKD